MLVGDLTCWLNRTKLNVSYSFFHLEFMRIYNFGFVYAFGRLLEIIKAHRIRFDLRHATGP